MKRHSPFSQFQSLERESPALVMAFAMSRRRRFAAPMSHPVIELHLIFFIHAKMGPETVLSEVPTENTSDIWLSPLKYSSVGQ